MEDLRLAVAAAEWAFEHSFEEHSKQAVVEEFFQVGEIVAAVAVVALAFDFEVIVGPAAAKGVELAVVAVATVA